MTEVPSEYDATAAAAAAAAAAQRQVDPTSTSSSAFSTPPADVIENPAPTAPADISAGADVAQTPDATEPTPQPDTTPVPNTDVVTPPAPSAPAAPAEIIVNPAPPADQISDVVQQAEGVAGDVKTDVTAVEGAVADHGTNLSEDVAAAQDVVKTVQDASPIMQEITAVFELLHGHLHELEAKIRAHL